MKSCSIVLLVAGSLLCPPAVAGLVTQEKVEEATARPKQPPIDVQVLKEEDAAEIARRKEEEKQVEMPEADVKKEVDELVARALSGKDGDFPALAQERRRRAMRDVGRFPHTYTLKVLKDVVASKAEPQVRRAAAEALGDMKFDRRAVATWLIARIPQFWKDEQVLIGIAIALGELREPIDREKMYEFFKHNNDPVYVSMIQAIGAMKDRPSLPRLYAIFAQYGGKSTAGVNVRVDTGAAGNTDQQAAEARGRGQLKKASVDRREGALHAVKQAVFQITGRQFEYHDEFYDWLKENSKDLGLGELELRKQ